MSTAPVVTPRLRDGEQLTAQEFLRRWEADSGLKFAELIDGTVYMPSPLRLSHGVYDALARTLCQVNPRLRSGEPSYLAHE